MIRSKAQSWPPHKYIRKFHRRLLDFRQSLIREIQIEDGDVCYRFNCETVREFYRCLKLFSKEPGTCEWISNNLHPGDVFYDIGANIGVYSILAATRIGEKGRVYAFEPHGANFGRLVDNISVNNFQNIIMPCNFALHNQEGFFSFKYASSAVGTSNSQLLDKGNVTQPTNEAQVSELKYATTIDRLLECNEIKAPSHVKIDVDGNEYLILQGMSHLLDGADHPKSLQVEMNDPHKEQIISFMGSHKYRLSSKHYTRSGLRRIEEGTNPQTIGFNAIFFYEG